MSPDSFLLDPFLLFADGLILAFLWERVWKGKGRTPALPVAIGVVILAIFWSISVSLFFDLAWVDWFAKMCGAKTGRDWMLNSGVFHFDYQTRPSTGLIVFATSFFASYAFWLLLGVDIGVRFATRPSAGH